MLNEAGVKSLFLLPIFKGAWDEIKKFFFFYVMRTFCYSWDITTSEFIPSPFPLHTPWIGLKLTQGKNMMGRSIMSLEDKELEESHRAELASCDHFLWIEQVLAYILDIQSLTCCFYGVAFTETQWNRSLYLDSMPHHTCNVKDNCMGNESHGYSWLLIISIAWSPAVSVRPRPTIIASLF